MLTLIISPIILSRIEVVTSFVNNNLFVSVILFFTLFMILQELLAFFKTKKKNHKLFSCGFSFILLCWILFYLSVRFFKARSLGYFISGISGIICFFLSFYFIVVAIKYKNKQ